MDKKILVVDDEKPIVEILKLNLQKENYDVYEAYDGEEALLKAKNIQPDLILLDVMLPKIDGFTVCRKIRETSTVPILMLTAREEEVDKVLGLELGADDYITKPFSIRELMARIKANMRRVSPEVTDSPAEKDTLEIGNFLLDFNRYELYKNGKLIDLTVREFDLIFKLLSYPKKTFTRSKLMDEFWDVDTNSSTRTVDVYMTKLRDKFSHCTEFEIVTVHGLGYKAVIKT